MRVWEAIEMLQGMDGNKEVTVTIGKPKKVQSIFNDGPAYQVLPTPPPPTWVIDHHFWPSRPEITCKS